MGVATQEVELWWPNGHGGQTLYPLTVWVEDPGLNTVHSETKQVRGQAGDELFVKLW